MEFSGTTNLQKGSYLKRHNKLETLLLATSEEIKQKKVTIYRNMSGRYDPAIIPG